MPNGDERYDTHDYAGDRADDVSAGQRNLPQEDRSTNAEIQQHISQSQQQQLESQVEMGNDRVVVPQNWESRTSTELYAAGTELNVPTSADGLGRGFTEGGNRLAEAANRLLDAVGKLDQAWKGEAAEAARGALTPLAQATGQAGVAAQYMGTAMSDQATAAATVRNLPQPMEFNADAELATALANPNPIAGMNDMAAKEQEAKAVKQEQVTYLNNYTTTMGEIDSRTPTFVPPPPRIDDGGGGDTGFQDSARVNYADGLGDSRGYTPNSTTGTTTPSGFIPGHGPVTPTTSVPPPGGSGVNTGTTVSGFTPPPTTSPVTPPTSVGPGPTPTPQPSPVGGSAPVSPFGRGPGGAPPSGAGGSRPGMGARGGAGFGPGGNAGAGNPGAGRPGAGNPGAGRPGAGNPGAGRPGAGLGAGAGAGQGGPAAGRPGGGAGGTGGRGGAGMGAGGTGGRGGAGMGAGGTGGRGGAGMGAGGRGQGDEDTEHQRPSYLIEPDPEDAFGTDQVTAPPVIGE